MTIRHHLDIATLMTCSAGSQPEAHAAVILAHLAVCPMCRDALDGASQIGAALFESLPHAPLGSRAAPSELPVREIPARRDPSPDAAAARDGGRERFPAHLAAALGSELEAIVWQTAQSGVDLAPVRLSPAARGHLTLVRVAPGAPIPLAVMDGTELAFVLDGALCRDGGIFQAGDVADCDSPLKEPARADVLSGALCLVGTDRAEIVSNPACDRMGRAA